MIHNVIIDRIIVSDFSEDPIICLAEPLYKWEKSEKGQWVMAHAKEQPVWNKHRDFDSYHHVFNITAKLDSKDYTYYLLKWGHEKY